MTTWHLLRAHRTQTRAGLGYRVHRHGSAASVLYSSVLPAEAETPDGSRSFCLSGQKVSLQQLNERLASYLQQVQSLETANQRLQRQIQEQLDRKCPRELRQLDGYLRTASLLQDQISECLSAQAQLKLQLLSAELAVFDFNARCEKERERGGCVEEDLNNMRLLEEMLKVHTLPELQTLLNDKTQQRIELQIHHQQDMQGLLAQGSGGVAVQMQSNGSSHLIQQLDDLRQMSVMQHDKNQNDFWFNAQASMLGSPEVTLDPPAGSEVVRAELEELRRTVATLEEELTHLQALNMVLEASGTEQTESFMHQLVDIQQRADGLCRDLDSVLQSATQQAADYQVLLDIKSRLETEIQDYKRLLDGPSRQGFSSLYSNSNVRSFCGPTSPSAFRRNITVNKTVSFPGGNLRIMGGQNVPRGHVCTVRKTPGIAPLSETVTTVQPIRVHRTHPKSSLVRSINTSNLTGSFHKSENQRTGSLSSTNGRQSSPVKDKVHSKDSDAAQGITTLVPDEQSAKSAAVQAKPESFTSKKVITEAGLQNKQTGTNSQTEITKNIVCAESELKEAPCSITNINAMELTKETAAEVKKETETVTPDQMICIEGSFQTKNQDPTQVVSLSFKTQAEAHGDAGEVGVTASVVSGPALGAEETQSKVSNEEAVKASKLEMDTTQGITTLVPDEQSARSAAVQAKPETLPFKQVSTEAGLQAKETGKNIQTEITKNIVCAESELKEGPCSVTHITEIDPNKETAAELKKETETVTPDQMICIEGSFQTKNQDPAQVVSLSLKTPAETHGDAGEIGVTASVVSGPALGAEETQSKVSNEEAVKTSKLEMDTTQGITTLVPDEQSARSAAVQAKPETLPFKQVSTEAGLQAKETGKNIQTEITETIVWAESEVKEAPCSVTNITATEPTKETAAEVKKETETVILAQINCTEGSFQIKNQDPAQIPTETDGDEGEVDVTASVVSGPPPRSEDSQGKASGELTLIDDKDIERELKKEEAEDIESILSNASNGKQNKVMEDADMGSGFATASSGSTDSKDNHETANTEILKKVELEMNKGKVIDSFHDAHKVKVDPTELDNEIIDLAGQEELLSTTKSKKSINLTDSDVCLSSSDHEEILSPIEAHIFLSPTKPFACLSPETCLNPVETEVEMSMTNQGFCPVNLEEQVQSPDSHLSPHDPEMFLSPNDSDTCLSPVEAKGCLSPNGEEEDEDVCLNLTEARTLVRPVEKYILSTKEEDQSLSFSRDQALPEEDRNRKVSISVGDGDSIMDSEVRGQKNSDQVFVKSASFGSVPANERTTFDSQSGGTGMVSDLVASCGGTAANSSRTITGNTEAEVRGKFRRRSGDWMVYDGSLGRTSTTSPSTRNEEESPSGATPPGTNCPETARFGSGGIRKWMVYGGSLGRKRSLDGEISLPREGKECGPSVFTNPATSPQETGRFCSRGGGEWMIYGGSLGRKSSLPTTGSEERLAAVTLPATNPPHTRRFGSEGSGERMVYCLKHSDSLPIAGSRESQSAAMHLQTSPPETGRFGSRGSGEWRVYGGSTGRVSGVAGSNSLPNAVSEESLSVVRQLATSPPGAPRAGRFGSADSGEWRVYGGTSASNADRVSVSASYGQVVSPPSSYTGSGPRPGSTGSGGSVVRRSSSVGSGGRLRSSGSGSKLSSSPRSHMTSSSGRFGSTGSGESKPVYSSASGRRSTVGGAGGQSGAGRTTSSQRAPSPGGRMSAGSAGWLSSSPIGGSRVSSPGSGSKLNSAGSGRTNSTGGRVISSSHRPIRSTGSGAGGNKERISVCKMAALSISAAGRERSQDRRGQPQWSKQQQQQQAAATSPLVQRWLTSGVGSTSAEPDGLDDIMRL